VVTDLSTPFSFPAIAYSERLTGAPLVSLRSLSTLFTSVTKAMTAVICGSGDRDHILDRGGVSCRAPFFTPFFGDERNRPDAGASCSAIGTRAPIVAPAYAAYVQSSGNKTTRSLIHWT
jgi:hypothetical protein